ncbi:MAG: HAD-IA family hydrolase [Muribaculaceae bacterium]|nr:HAD-IA family hydrolase [Alistipes senegalensis]MCM1473586.1 HAD-IA family hydrolase [Muribaculaceae bacterium]
MIAIFDLDGTLADTLYDLADATNYGLEKLGYPVHPYESYRQFVGNGVQKLCWRALPDDKKDDTGKLLEIFSGYYGKHFLDKTRLYHGMKNCLEILRENNVILAVATNKPQNFAREIIDKLLPEFNFVKVLGGCAERPKKPDTSIIDEIISDFPEEENIFMIGDSNVDIQTAKNAGIRSIGCVWGFRGIEELTGAGADFIADIPEDIVKFII